MAAAGLSKRILLQLFCFKARAKYGNLRNGLNKTNFLFSWLHEGHQQQGKRCFGQPVAQTHPHLIQEGHVTPGITSQEYRSRRLQLMEKVREKCHVLGHNGHAIVIIPSAPKVYMSQDIPYTFRQNTDFLYLCGFLEPDSVLIMETHVGDSSEVSSTLFVPRKDPLRELWDGPRSGKEGAIELTGIDSAYNIEELEDYLKHYIQSCRNFMTWYDLKKTCHVEYHVKYISKMLKDSKNITTESPRNFLHMLRIIKSPAEIELMKQTCSIASNSFREVMKFSRHAMNESHLFAKMEFECKLFGAQYLAYPPVVAGGNRANTIHYVSNNQLIDDGDMVLMDAGCEFHGYTSDITRTWPINGKFSQMQRDLYAAVLEVQKSCISSCVMNGMTMDQLYKEMLCLIGLQLQRLSILPSYLDKEQLLMFSRQFCPHHVSHYLGMDVHDTDEMPRNLQLLPGMVITVEPGIYIPLTRVDVAQEWRGIGLRIEDDVLVTNNGPYILSHECPKEIRDIEKLLSNTCRENDF